MKRKINYTLFKTYDSNFRFNNFQFPRKKYAYFFLSSLFKSANFTASFYIYSQLCYFLNHFFVLTRFAKHISIKTDKFITLTFEVAFQI